MSTLETEDEFQSQNNLSAIESLRFPLDSSMRIVFTGYFTGFSVEVRSVEEVALLYHMGCFGKGSASRSKPRLAQTEGSPVIMRKRQFLKRNYWYHKFASPRQTSDEDVFLKEIEDLGGKIIIDTRKKSGKDVIDLVSSEEDMSANNDEFGSTFLDSFQIHDKEDVVVTVPNSDSEEDNYFAQLKPKCCLNKIKLQEKLILSLQEAFFLLYGLGCLQIINVDNKLLNIQQTWDLFTETDKNFIKKYVTYHYFRSKGYVVKPGIKFGGDYLLYKEGPGIMHADFIVVIKHEEEKCCWVSLLGHVRMAATTVKEILIAEVIEPSGSSQNLPEGLSTYSVRETIITRKLPVTLNDEDIE